MTYKYIKQLVESASGIKDIGIESRKAEVRDARYTYSKLCYLYVDNFTLAGCGKVINRDHSTIVHAIKKFDEGLGKKWFTGSNIYYICNPTLKKLQIESINNTAEFQIKNLTQSIDSFKDLRDKLINKLNE